MAGRFPVPFVGPSYQLSNRKADVQRSVNLYPVKVESGTGKAPFFLKSVPGLTAYATNTTQTTFQAVTSFGDTQTFCVMGTRLFELDGTTLIDRGGAVLSTAPGVIMAAGRLHVVMVGGVSGYVYRPDTTTFTQITDPQAPTNPNWVAYLAGRYIMGVRFEDSFFWSAIDDPLSWDALDFATAESSPDGLVRGVVYREELWLMGTKTTEVWRASSSAGSAFERNTGVSISVGCAGAQTVATLDNSLFWVGRDENGGAIVYMAAGYQPRRVSNHAIEEMLSGSTDITQASAYCYQKNGHAFYCLNAPGLESTLCYDVSTDSWHERVDYFNGVYQPLRVTHHVMSPLGDHLFGATLSGHPTISNRSVFYTESDDVYTIAGDTLIRDRISPHFATPELNRVNYSRFRLDCSVGTAVVGTKYVQLSYSDDGGYTWSDSLLQRSLGATGARKTMIQWTRLGTARDRVWKLRCTDDVTFDIVGVDVQAESFLA